MNQFLKNFFVSTGLALAVACTQETYASSTVISGTRVIYNAKDSEEAVQLTNNGKLPALAEVWLDSPS